MYGIVSRLFVWFADISLRNVWSLVFRVRKNDLKGKFNIIKQINIFKQYEKEKGSAAEKHEIVECHGQSIKTLDNSQKL